MVVAAVVVVVVLIKTGKIDLSGSRKDDGATEAPAEEPAAESPETQERSEE